MRGASEVVFDDDSMTGPKQQVVESLIRSCAQYCRNDSNVTKCTLALGVGMMPSVPCKQDTMNSSHQRALTTWSLCTHLHLNRMCEKWKRLFVYILKAMARTLTAEVVEEAETRRARSITCTLQCADGASKFAITVKKIEPCQQAVFDRLAKCLL